MYSGTVHKPLPGEGTSKKSEWVMLMTEAKDTFQLLKKACLEAPMLILANLDKPSLLETGTSKLGLGAVLFQKHTDGQYHLVAYPSESLIIHKCNYHSSKQEILALKLVIAEQFQEYLLWEPVHCQN